MTDTYTLLDAMREEVDTLKELEAVYRKQEKLLVVNDYVTTRRSLERIIHRFEKGHEYYMGINAEGDPQLKYRVGTRHLEREYPAVAKAKQNLDTVVNLTKDSGNV
jgi:hypoxanthine phosphoribosyltransferase